MSREEQEADHLRKVLLRIEPVGEGGSPAGDGAPFEFVFGIGSRGLSPLEMALQGFEAGEEMPGKRPRPDRTRLLHKNRDAPEGPGRSADPVRRPHAVS